MSMVEQISAKVEAARERLAAASETSEIEAVRIELLGRNGFFTAAGKTMGSLPPEERKTAGRAFNAGRGEVEKLIAEAAGRLSRAAAASEHFDPTLPARLPATGHKHPIIQVMDECVAIFRRMGFVVADGPEIDDCYHNFDALNTAADHPSRDEKDTFYLPDGRLLRSQTSTVQIRTMESRKPPIRIVAPGRCFRRDTPDATHGMNFHQIEGLYVDEGVSMADLKSVLQGFARDMFGPHVKIRLRPHFFPFTEPSVEYDFSCIMCGGKGCGVCKNSGWLEIAGAGMVDTNVFRNVGYDPERWTGFAFGMGLERIAMLRYRIGDLRWLYENDVRMLEQF